MNANSHRPLTEPQQLAWDTILRRPTKGIPICQINPMEWRMIDRLAGVPEGTYQKDPVPTYRKMLENSGVCLLDQWIPTNPLTMTEAGFDHSAAGKSPTTGMSRIVCDGICIDSPEAVVSHLEQFVFPALEKATASFDEDATVARLLREEARVQAELGDRILKAPYCSPLAAFPALSYGAYGYECYLMAYALFPEVMEKHFELQADYALKHNRAGARAIREGGLPPCLRLDHDMADARGTLVDIRSLDRLWFPHFSRCLKPFLDARLSLIWHCDGNLSQMVPRLLDCGLAGFQGFQYECGMDYERICRMKTRDGAELLIIAGVSVTRTLPFGTPDDVKKELRWLVERGPRQGLFLGCSSSIAPGVPWENLKVLIEGFRHYRAHGR